MGLALLTNTIEIRPELVCTGAMALVLVSFLVSWVIAKNLAESLSPSRKAKVPDKRKREPGVVTSLEQKLKQMHIFARKPKHQPRYIKTYSGDELEVIEDRTSNEEM